MGLAASSFHDDSSNQRPRATSNSNGRKSKAGAAKILKFTIPSEYEAGRDVQKQILDEVKRNGFNAQNEFAIKLALEEGLINAIKHGNRLDAAKKVHIEVKVSPTKFEISIEDEGPGFVRTHVPDPTLDENLDKCSGRGILLMESYMSSVKYSNKGRRVTMTKKNEPDVHPRK